MFLAPSTDLRGSGYWYDRLHRRYITIHDHAIDASVSPRVYRVTEEAVTRVLEGYSPANEKGRDRLIPFIASRGFIRVRWVPRQGVLGWQFAGDPFSAADVLRRFADKCEVGPSTVVTFTDFGFGGVVTTLRDTSAITDLCHAWETARRVA